MKRPSPRGTAKHPAKRHGEAGAGAARKAAPATQPKRRRSKPGWIDTLDATHERCENIEALAGLLSLCGQELPEPWLLQRTGSLIEREVTHIRELLETWNRKGARP